MESKSDFVRLEEFVDNMLAKYKMLKERCAILETTLEQRETESAKLNDKITELRSERKVVGERVAGLIDRIEKWEKDLDDGEMVAEDDMAKLQGKLFKNEQAAAK